MLRAVYSASVSLLCVALAALDLPESAWAVTHRHTDHDTVDIRVPGQAQPLAQLACAGPITGMQPHQGRLILSIRQSDGSLAWHRWTPGNATVERLPLPQSLGLQIAIPAPDGNWVGTARLGDGDAGHLVLLEADGSGLRRLTPDLYGAADPSILADGRIVYTRWHSPSGASGLVAVNPDGTNAMGLVDSPIGTVLRQARSSTDGRIVAIQSDPHTATGPLVTCDPARGPDPTHAVRTIEPTDGHYRQPWPLPDGSIVAAWSPTGTSPWTIVRVQDGRRDPLWSNGDAGSAVPMHPPMPLARPSLVDWRLAHGWIYVLDVYRAGRLAALPRGSAFGLRIATAIPQRTDQGQVTWRPEVLGTAPIASDGSVFAQVPARIPLAFDIVAADGRVLGTMGRWTMLQRGERVSCLGCHAPANQVPRVGGAHAFGLSPAEIRLPGHLSLDPPNQAEWLRGEQQRIQDLVLNLLGGN